MTNLGQFLSTGNCTQWHT